MRDWKRTAAILGVGAIVALAGFWLWASPAWTLRDMREAARRGDVAALDAHIDYPTFRENLKRQMVERLSRQSGQGPAAGLAVAFGSGMIDRLVTPAMLRAMIQGAADGEGVIKGRDVGIDRTGLTQFIAGTPGPEGDRGGAVFALQGVTWRIVDVRISKSTAGPPVPATAAPPPAWPRDLAPPGIAKPTK